MTNKTNESTSSNEVDMNDIDNIVAGLGPCAKQYWDMDQCLESNNHRWVACQKEVYGLKMCYNKLEEQGLRTVQSDRAVQTEIQRLKLIKKQHEAEQQKSSKTD